MLRILIVALCCIGMTSAAVTCWNCINAKSNQECLEIGRKQKCDGENDMCEVDFRITNGRPYITKRCKQDKACQNNEKGQEFQRNAFQQCLLQDSSRPEVCYCCCENDLCNKDALDCLIVKTTTTKKVTTTSTTTTTKKITTPTVKPTCLKCDSSIHIDPFPFGKVTCTDKNCVGSTCRLTCDNDDDILLPAISKTVRCNENRSWNHKIPCCAKKCPPNAKMDIAIVMDSSGSIKGKNWDTGKRFVETILDVYKVGRDTTRYAVLRFNEDVDEETLIQFNQYYLPLQLQEGVKKIQYSGRGTKTGKALEYLKNNVLVAGTGYRLSKDIPAVVVLFTDGRAKDKPEPVAQQLLDQGVAIITVWVKGQRDAEDEPLPPSPDGVFSSPVDEDMLTEVQLRSLSQSSDDFFSFESFESLNQELEQPRSGAMSSPIHPDVIIDELGNYRGTVKQILERLRFYGCKKECRR